MGTEGQYIEAFDSVRLSWKEWSDPDNAPGDSVRADRLQAFAEVLLAFALGETVIIPHTYAFDSLLFAQVADHVLQARDRIQPRGHVPVAERIHPFRIHLFKKPSFQSAVVEMLSRSSTPEHPFYRSLLPDLRDPSGLAKRIADGEWYALWAALDDQREPLLRRIRGEFDDGDSPRRCVARITEAPSGFVSLEDQVLRLLDSERDEEAMVEAALAEADISDAPLSRLVGALRKLDHRSSDVPSFFAARSRLRPYIDADGNETNPALEILESREDLALVTEFLDTLYNGVVVRSYGNPRASFSTALLSEPGKAQARNIAQALAWATSGAAPAPDQEQRPVDGGPLFALEVSAPQQADEHAWVERAVMEDLQRHSVDAIEAVLSLWPDPKFQESRLRRVELATRATSEAEVHDCIKTHLAMVGDVLSRACRIDVPQQTEAQELTLTLGGAAAGLGGGLMAHWNLMTPTMGGVLASAAAIAGAALPPADAWRRRRRQAKADRQRGTSIAASLGACLNVTSVRPQAQPG